MTWPIDPNGDSNGASGSEDLEDLSPKESKFDANLLSYVGTDEHVSIDAIAAGDTARLAEEIRRLGGQNVARAGGLVSATVPASALPELHASDELQSARTSRVFSGPDQDALREAATESGGVPQQIAGMPAWMWLALAAGAGIAIYNLS